MEFPFFVALIIVVFWLMDQLINLLVELLLKFSQLIRAVSIVVILSFLLGVYYAPEQVADLFGNLIHWFADLAESISQYLTWFWELFAESERSFSA